MKNLSDEALLRQLGYTQTNGILGKLKNIIRKTDGYEDIKKHLLALHDNLKQHNAFVALSSTEDFFKIKNLENSKDATDYIHKWAHKYNVNLLKVAGKETYYITGKALLNAS
jgi:hypothetical protein